LIYTPEDDNEEDAPECSNGYDDDGDGAIDYPDDGGCESSDGDNEARGGVAEDNDVDNDGVPNNQDNCPGTPEGTPVNDQGCPTGLLGPDDPVDPGELTAPDGVPFSPSTEATTYRINNEGEDFRGNSYAEVGGKVGDTISFTRGGEEHTSEIIDINTNALSVTLRFSSEPQVITFALGIPLGVDLDLDGTNDIAVLVNDIFESEGVITTLLTIVSIPEDQEETDLDPLIDSITGDENNKAGVSFSTGKEGRNITIILIVAIVVILVIIYFLIYIAKKRKEEEEINIKV